MSTYLNNVDVVPKILSFMSPNPLAVALKPTRLIEVSDAIGSRPSQYLDY